MIDSNSIENLKTRLDIVDIVGHYMELKRNGANWKCICPFHDDSNPSLVVSPSKQIYHCFSCGAGGDGIKFVMEYEKLTYPESIEKLALIYNFSLSYTANDGKIKEDRKLLENINMFFKKNLNKKKEVLKYLKQRGISEASIEKFELGYAPNSEESLIFLSSNGYHISEGIEVGVVGVGENGSNYARFIDRLMFPIKSVSDKIVGFGGRTISGHQAKYVNSPKTKLFNKSYLLYGYSFAKDSIYQNRSIIITEGYFDVIMLHQAGFTNAVATLGTALTKEHIPLIGRGNPKVILAYDGDNAGVEAALKASMMLSAIGIAGGVVLFTKGMDPADMVQKDEVKKLGTLFSSPQPFIEFTITKIVKKYNLHNPLEKQKALEEGSAYLKTLPSLIASSYSGVLSGNLNIDPKLVKVQTHKSNRLQGEQKIFEDMLELTIIKTLLIKPSFIDTLLDTIDVSMFKTHNMELLALLNHDRENPSLRKILLNDDIKEYNEKEFLESMLNFLIRFYNLELNRVKSLEMDYKNKSFKIRKIQKYIFQLKEGKLVKYEKE
ncbi:MAG: DNA primase [Sulfurospirillum sp.]|nr:DNA primase [Sulfurospirillum sp.]MBL0703432.1 DNA primase [Sulfurospirillum sp.]